MFNIQRIGSGQFIFSFIDEQAEYHKVLSSTEELLKAQKVINRLLSDPSYPGMANVFEEPNDN